MSSLGRYVVDAVVLEHRSPTQLARDHGISKRWVFELLRRFKEGWSAALEQCSRRSKSCTHQVATKVQRLIVKLRGELSAAGHDAGPETIAHHLKGEVDKVPSVATVWRILKRNGLINPQPHKRPKASFIRFEAKLPNETWQLDSTPWQLADATPVELLNYLDDKSRLALASQALVTVKAADPVHVLYSASNVFGLPASLLSDNAAVFTGKSRRGKDLLQGRALPPNCQALFAQAASSTLYRRAPVSARRVSRVLQHPTAPSSTQPADTARSFQRTPQGQACPAAGAHRPPCPSRQNRLFRQGHPPLPGPTQTHPCRRGPQEQEGQSPRRRSRRPHRCRRRTTDPNVAVNRSLLPVQKRRVEFVAGR